MDGLRLVNYGLEWAVCRIKTVDEEPGPYHLPDDPIQTYEAWVYGKNDTVLCRVGQEECTYPLPSWEPTNFFRDRFPFAIDIKSDFTEHVEKVGGCNNAASANAAFEAQLHIEGERTTVRLRHGSRIIREGKGKGDFREWLASRKGD